MFDIEKRVRPAILKRKEYVPGKPVEEVEREYGIRDIIKLASNENPLGASPMAVEAMIREIRKNACSYPESLCPELGAKLAGVLGVTPDSIFIDNGADGVISMLGLTFFNPEDEIVFPALSFPAYDNIAAKMGCKSVPVPMKTDFSIDVPAMINAVNEKTKMVFFCNPNNPTGLMTKKEAFCDLMARIPEQVPVVSDEVYSEFVDSDDYPAGISLLDRHPNLIVLRSFSKIWGLAGLRIGYAVASPAIVRAMRKAREPFPVNRIAQAGALAALDDNDFMERTKQLTREGLGYYYQAFDAMGLKYFRSFTNFIMVDTGKDADGVFQDLLKKGIIVRPLTAQGMKTGLRITVGRPEQNEKVILALKEILSN